MKTVLFFVAFAITTGLNAQTPSITGKWKVIVFDAGVYHDYKKDSTYFPEEFHKSITGSKDSALAIGLIKMLILGFKDYQMVFGNDGSYQEITRGKIKEEGSYTIDLKKNMIVTITTTKSGIEKKQELLFELKGAQLRLKVPSEKKNINIILERVE